MQTLNAMNSREIKQVRLMIEEQFGVKPAFDTAFFKNSEDKIFLMSKSFAEIDPQKLRINSMGLYFGKLENAGLRLSIEGSQLVNPQKNVVEISKDDAHKWMLGDELKVDDKLQGYAAVKCDDDILGCGFCKNGKLINYVPKGRRLNTRIIE